MKKRKGFISIIALILMYVVLSMALYLGYISKLEYSIVNGSNHKTQSYYQSEGKIHLALNDDKYYFDQLYINLLDVFRTNNFATSSKKVTINDEDLNFGDDIKDVIIKFKDKDNRINMNMVANSNVNGVKSKIESSGTIVNELFEIEYPILYPNLLDGKYEQELNDLLKAINESISIHNCYKSKDIFGLESTNFSKIILKEKDKDNYEISSTRESMVDPYIERFNKKEVFIIARKMENEKLEFLIGDTNPSSNTIELSGILFVEGDIKISSNFQFKGIIVVRNGKIITESKDKPKIFGLVILDDIENYDHLVEKNHIVRSRHIVYQYGTYLPEFLDPQLTTIKLVGN